MNDFLFVIIDFQGKDLKGCEAFELFNCCFESLCRQEIEIVQHIDGQFNYNVLMNNY